MRKMRAKKREPAELSDAVIIGPYEVMLIGKTVEVLRKLPRGLESGELWHRLEAALAFDTGGSVHASDAPAPRTGGVRIRKGCAE